MKKSVVYRIPFLSKGINRLWLLMPLLESKPLRTFWPWVQGSSVRWLGWGKKPSARMAALYAMCSGARVSSLEDGFIRSFNTGEFSPPLSVVVDELGIYYDSTQGCELERLLASEVDVLDGHESYVKAAYTALMTNRLSKYNHFAHSGEGNGLLGFVPNYERLGHVLVVDQTVGDMSVSLGSASAKVFQEMLTAARTENPLATIYVKTHPEVSSGRKGGYLTHVQTDDRTLLLRDAVNPMSLLGHMDKVYVVTSTMGFEALLAGKPVVCFGVPWYAGWGVTDDRCNDSSAWDRRKRQRSVRELFAAAYIHYTRYLNPVTHQRGTILDVIDWLVRQKEMANLMHGEQRQGRVVGVGFRRWKAANLKPMLGLHRELVQFVPNASGVRKLSPQPGETLVSWGASPPSGLSGFAQDKQLKLLHLEDGFVRSVGLGSDLIRPQSLVLDKRGIYFDATRPSDLEHMLANREFTPDDVQRAQQVRAFIVEHDITKYNLEPRQTVQWPSSGRLVVLVPGQVEDDASIRLGCTSVRTNLDLLRAVRQARPDAFIVYKPHPDVLSLNRKGRVALAAAHEYADHVEAGVSVVSCIDACNEVHTMTSLTGFDALLRGKKVVTYGQPFYAGWGLTEDRAENATAFERRQRRLTLDELVAGALLHYPIYWDWDLKGYTTCEAVLHRIVEQRTALEANGGLHKLRVGFVRRQLRKAKVLFVSWTGRL
jgi:capsular polysaccharide export protein